MNVFGDFAMDRKLGIRSGGVREWLEDVPEYNRFEATPYRALDDLFHNYQPGKNAHLVDFGCGLGRVIFYFHYRFKTRGTGIELNDETFPDLLRNLEHYKQARGKDVPIDFIQEPAETVALPEDSNIFFFFNPFSFRIFEKVMDNVVNSLITHPRPAYIILYYPLESYRSVIRGRRVFKLVDEIRLAWGVDRYDRFLIYRYDPESKEAI